MFDKVQKKLYFHLNRNGAVKMYYSGECLNALVVREESQEKNISEKDCMGSPVDMSTTTAEESEIQTVKNRLYPKKN